MARKPPSPLQTQDQLGLFAGGAEPPVPVRDWPDPKVLPHNEADSTVGAVVNADLLADGDALVVVGYASLDHVVRLLSQRPEGAGRVRILFGHEPFPARRDAPRRHRARLADEAREYWLARGISVLYAQDVLNACQRLRAGAAEVRIASANRPVHAKLYCTRAAVTLGSSNFTDNGLSRQSEANARFTPADPRFAEAWSLGEGLWDGAKDYLADLIDLLERLLQSTTWKEALARACAELLEGEWAKKYVPPEELASLDRPLWPHQLQGISQAMWILHNRGSVLVADATGSGKTRMGAWLLRAAFDRLVRAGLGRRVPPVAIAPPPVVTGWKDQLQECGLNWEVHSHGPLSNNKAEAHNRLIAAIGGAELLAVDEAHNFLNDSERTKRLRSHYADHAVLFTATPINRGAADLIGLVELLGPDNFPDEALDVLKRLQRLRRAGSGVADQADRDDLRAQIQQFMVRRTRRDLNRIVDAAPEQYAMPEGRRARYPHHKAQFYALNAPKEDLEAARQIVALCAQLKGIARVGKSLFLPKSLAIEGLTEADYLQRVVRSAAGLARHLVLDCLRSSRIALYEHVHGTEAACNKLAPYLSSLAKSATGDTLETLAACAGTPPEWKFEGLSKDAAPAWLVDPEAHRQACEEERKVYADIAAIALTMSEAREAAKVAHLIQLQRRKGMVLAFDTHVLSLLLFDHLLRSRKAKVQVFSGEGGASAKRKAMKHFARDGEGDALIALCTDAFSEGMNLQAASVVVHLDTPTVIRTAEQRAGRVDRMDSLHDEVEIWFPRDSEDFAPRNRDLLMERHELVSDLIGPNLQLPEAEDRSDEALEVEKLADLDVEDPQALFDAFRPVRAMVEPGGLVGPRDYAAMRDSQAEVVSCVSLVSSDRMWAFFAVAGLDRAAPRWIFLDGPDAAPEGDLARVAASLAERLGPEVPDHPIDREAKEAISALVARLGACERDLLPVRRRRALELAAKVVPTWRDQAFRDDDRARGELLRELARLLAAGPGSEEQPDARAVADAWLHVFRQVQQRVDAEGGRRKPLRRLGELASALIERPVETETLRRAFRDIPLLPPVSERIVAMIVGVPVALG